MEVCMLSFTFRGHSVGRPKRRQIDPLITRFWAKGARLWAMSLGSRADRIQGEASHRGRALSLIDTGGIIPNDAK